MSEAACGEYPRGIGATNWSSVNEGIHISHICHHCTVTKTLRFQPQQQKAPKQHNRTFFKPNGSKQVSKTKHNKTDSELNLMPQQCDCCLNYLTPGGARHQPTSLTSSQNLKLHQSRPSHLNLLSLSFLSS